MTTQRQTIAIFTFCHPELDPWDPSSMETGLPGAEETVVYMAEELARLGYKVTVFGHPPRDSMYSAPDVNPRYVNSSLSHVPSFDIAISWRMPEMISRLKKIATKVYFWPHDSRDTLGKHLAALEQCDEILWVSEWQRDDWVTEYPSLSRFHTVIGNGIVEEQFHSLKERENPYSCIYGSNYAKGLGLLVYVWPTVKKLFPRATLDICYGWNHWGLMRPEAEMYVRKEIDRLRPLDVREHGRVGRVELTRMFEEASFWTYPCIGVETFSITAIRAQYAGALPVVIDSTALRETVQFGWACSSPQDYLGTMIDALRQAENIPLSERARMRTFVQNNYTWKRIAARWKELFDSHMKDR